MKVFRLALFLGTSFLISCNGGWISDLDTAFIGDDKSQEKPLCQFEVSENCWSRSLKLIMACVQPPGEEPEVFTEDLRFCSNKSGKLVEFSNPLDLVGNFEQENLQFKVYNGQKRCFRFTGNQHSFRIDQNSYGSLEVTSLGNGDTHVACPFNESFVIPAQVKKQGCRGEKAKVADFLPRAGLEQLDKRSGLATTENFLFYFAGTGVARRPVFKCFL